MSLSCFVMGTAFMCGFFFPFIFPYYLWEPHSFGTGGYRADTLLMVNKRNHTPRFSGFSLSHYHG